MPRVNIEILSIEDLLADDHLRSSESHHELTLRLKSCSSLLFHQIFSKNGQIDELKVPQDNPIKHPTKYRTRILRSFVL